MLKKISIVAALLLAMSPQARAVELSTALGGDTVGSHALNCNADFILDQLHEYSSTVPVTLATVSDCWNLDGPINSKSTFQIVTRSNLPTNAPYNYAQKVTTTTPVTLAATDHSQVKFQLTGREIATLGWGLAGTQTELNPPRSAVMEGWIQCNSTVPSYPASIPFWVNNNAVRGGGYRTYIHLVSVPAADTWTQFSFVIPADTADFWASGINAGVSLVGGYTLGAGANFQTSTVDAWVTGNFFGTSTSTNLISTSGAACYFAGIHFRHSTVSASQATQLPYQSLPVQMEYDRVRKHIWKTFYQGLNPAQNVGTGTGEYCVANPIANGQPSIQIPLPGMIGGVSQLGVASATVNAAGSGGTNGTNVRLTVSGGTGTAAVLFGTISGNALTAVTGVASPGTYTSFPGTTNIAVTGGGLTGATVNLTSFIQGPGVPAVTLYNPGAANANCRNETAGTDVACSVVGIPQVNGFTVQTTAPVTNIGDQICVHALVDTGQ